MTEAFPALCISRTKTQENMQKKVAGLCCFGFKLAENGFEDSALRQNWIKCV